MSPVEFKKRPCRPVEFKGQGPLVSVCVSSAGVKEQGQAECAHHVQ